MLRGNKSNSDWLTGQY